ncbi:MAG TPA: hypothetical protein VK929_07480 [Longimicrobiales bacterium]|nr:hypothetical protein [Longimicrobiales bacterium]
MDADTRARAEMRLTDAAAALGLADPRPPLRERLKQLRESRDAGFQQAVRHYEDAVLPRLADEEPLQAWLDYARFVGQLSSNGRLMAIDATGLATPVRGGLAGPALVLFLPEDTAVPPLVAAQPLDSSDAQQAARLLLVERKLALG